MRFAPLHTVLLGLIILQLPLLSAAATAQTYIRASAPSAAPDFELRHRPRGSSEAPQVPEGLYASRAATGLGDVNALVSGNDGTIYALSRSKGELIRIDDRGRDGRMDTQRVFSAGFDRPTGLAMKDGQLYVADKTAIWRVDENGLRQKFVSLAKIKVGEPRPILVYENRLLLGLTTGPETSQVLSVDLSTGVATLLTELPEAPLRGLSYGGGQLWAAVGKSLRPVSAASNTDMAQAYPLESGAAAMAIMLPSGEIDYPENWPPALRNHILAVQGPTPSRPSATSSGGNNIISMPTQFGAPTETLSILAGGFSSRDGRSAWAAPSAMIMDARGLIFADKLGGSLWRLAIDDRPEIAPRERITPRAPKPPAQKPSLKPNETPAMAGSLIGEGSALGPASNLKVGSQLKKDFDDKEAAKLAAEKADEAAKIKAKEDAQEARRKARLGRSHSLD